MLNKATIISLALVSLLAIIYRFKILFSKDFPIYDIPEIQNILNSSTVFFDGNKLIILSKPLWSRLLFVLRLSRKQYTPEVLLALDSQTLNYNNGQINWNNIGQAIIYNSFEELRVTHFKFIDQYGKTIFYIDSSQDIPIDFNKLVKVLVSYWVTHTTNFTGRKYRAIKDYQFLGNTIIKLEEILNYKKSNKPNLR